MPSGYKSPFSKYRITPYFTKDWLSNTHLESIISLDSYQVFYRTDNFSRSVKVPMGFLETKNDVASRILEAILEDFEMSTEPRRYEELMSRLEKDKEVKRIKRILPYFAVRTQS